MTGHDIETIFRRKLRCRWFESFPAYQKFEALGSPAELTNIILDCLPITKSSSILEPSAGSGNIVREIRKRKNTPAGITAVELNKRLFKQLDDGSAGRVINGDFLKQTVEWLGQYDFIIMCPPKRTDEHIEHALKFLKKGGILVALVQKQNLIKTYNNYIALPDVFMYVNENIECGIICYEKA